MNTETSWAASAATASANRTGSRACRTQYPGSHPATSSPVSAPAHGTRGGAELQARGHLAQLAQHRVHPVRMERVAHPQPP